MSTIRLARKAKSVFDRNGWAWGTYEPDEDDIDAAITKLVGHVKEGDLWNRTGRLSVERDNEDGSIEVSIHVVLGWILPDGTVEEASSS